ncbi:MAG TPA: hypothetical protein G4O08_06855 [Anaerolineae bacterium]|nr:hypothetical protein [Anaerolineae bacterium]
MGVLRGKAMDALKGLFERKWVLPVATLVLGIALGLIYAWLIDPLNVIDTTPDTLRQDLREDYLRMAVDSYSVNREIGLAIQRYEELGEYGESVLEAIGADPGLVDPSAIQNFRAVITLPVSGDDVFEPAVPESTERASAWRVILPVGGVIVLVGFLIAFVLAKRSRMISTQEHYQPQPAQALEEVLAEPVVDLEKPAPPMREPLATFRTTYNLGDDSYDDAFSIESATGDFLGECGVGIADVIGVDGARKISSFEVWLFDKNDIQTVTKVILSQYAFDDNSTRTRLAAKGDPVLVESGGVVDLQTASIEVQARVVDYVYGEGVLPPRSFFERITIELLAFQRD